ncbi:hypothetical protein SNL152K_866 [Streptomyces sp. NL15-2K]|nr:hypothetical protein SNL152K_866 [Streptomyces sp. NL15-2K]
MSLGFSLVRRGPTRTGTRVRAGPLPGAGQEANPADVTPGAEARHRTLDGPV